MLHRGMHRGQLKGVYGFEIESEGFRAVCMHGLIECWERGRQKRIEDLELAARAESGQLVVLAWRGGVEVKLKNNQVKYGTYQYLATWQGLRGEDLDIEVDIERVIVCSKTGQSVIFTSNPLLDDGSA